MKDHEIDDHGLAPGDAAAPGSGENICPECGGTGSVATGETCPICEGTGKVVDGIAAA